MKLQHLRPITLKATLICLLQLLSYPLAAQNSNLTFHPDSSLATSSHQVYDQEGNLRVCFVYTYDSQGVVETRTIHGYDRHERHLTTHTYTFDDELIWQEVYKYDRRGNLVKRTQILYEGDSPITNTYSYKYDYNSDGTWSRCRYYLNGNLYHTINH